MKYCFKVTKLISESHERPLSFAESVGVRLHRLMCPRCDNFGKNCESLSKMMKDFATKPDNVKNK
ncbi:hypothetical protein K7G92_000259 [Pasteurella canis]|uniref:Zinc-finger domain-containing protein n=1 Tax=Pasteurella canis TaxID=753 RepID=A0A379ETH5_9PAST|nr:hypothetical protein [Pasteurella canis]MXN88625.1 hypothetical protein [Pasteurella canis]UDW84085.1 hypothetical protein K7G91_000323 [Pasteurella canis]UEA17092.1 hypothetical protein K7G92_000259 [Pasteurella canis]UEC23531.1 hypothetical protein K7G93_000253 [Pasteurella canis]SPY33547.1 Uncharacterised protein [Pasteurella canis]